MELPTCDDGFIVAIVRHPDKGMIFISGTFGDSGWPDADESMGQTTKGRPKS